jgi:hypothetical protein
MPYQASATEASKTKGRSDEIPADTQIRLDAPFMTAAQSVSPLFFSSRLAKRGSLDHP